MLHRHSQRRTCDTVHVQQWTRTCATRARVRMAVHVPCHPLVTSNSTSVSVLMAHQGPTARVRTYYTALNKEFESVFDKYSRIKANLLYVDDVATAVITNACYSQPCLNGGTCQAAWYDSNIFWCTCPIFYVGLQCECTYSSLLHLHRIYTSM